jgi:hypothetical protein
MPVLRRDKFLNELHIERKERQKQILPSTYKQSDMGILQPIDARISIVIAYVSLCVLKY